MVIIVFVFLVSCTRVLYILQPELANPNSVFEVPISILLEEDTLKFNAIAYFAVGIPNGWEVEDRISYVGVHSVTGK